MASAPEPQVQINQTLRGPIDDRPQSVHELMTRQMVLELKQEIAEVRLRVNGLIFTVIGAVVVQLVLLAFGVIS